MLWPVLSGVFSGSHVPSREWKEWVVKSLSLGTVVLLDVVSRLMVDWL